MPTLGYWDIRGLAEPIRLLLMYTGTEFEDRRFPCGDGPGFEIPEWKTTKFTLGMVFPNLPYYIDGDVKISQSNAILRYIGEKTGMVGRTEEEKLNCLEMQDVALDLRNACVAMFYHSVDYEKAKAKYLTNLPAKLKMYENCLEQREWFSGASITFPDFCMYELLVQHLLLDSNCFETFPKIQAFLKKVEDLEPIREFLKSDAHTKLPINNKMAHFTGP